MVVDADAVLPRAITPQCFQAMPAMSISKSCWAATMNSHGQAHGLDRLPAGQIAAIARSRAMALATRNIRDFEAWGLVLSNPWA